MVDPVQNFLFLADRTTNMATIVLVIGQLKQIGQLN